MTSFKHIAWQLLLIACSGLGDNAVAAEAPNATVVRFGTDVVPILTKLGCDSGGCHGKATGQNGFKLSLFGFEPELDYDALVTEGRGRRLSLADPDRSLLLLKATARVPHGGGRRLNESSDDYRILRDWIAQGAAAPRDDDPRLVRIEQSPQEQILPKDSSQQLRVTAFFSNGTSRDVTRQAVYQSNEPGIAAVDADGLVKTSSQHGLVAVMARFGDQIATFHAAVPFAGDRAKMAAAQTQLDQLAPKLAASSFDRLLLRQWRRLGVVPSAPADDATFLRRVTIDICGSLPTSDEVVEYLADTRSDKRARLIDRLLERPEYASYIALKWADILQNRGAGYSTSKQRAGTTLFAAWIRDSIAANKPYDQFVSEILTASGSQNENPPALWYRTVRKSPEYVESVAQAFLGVRVQCAQCHHHPTERWSQSDYFGLAAVFSRVGRKGGFADAEVPTDEIIFLKERGEVVHPRTGAILRPRPLGGTEFSLGLHDDPRSSLASWMTSADNPFFARTMVNRLWAHFLGRGIVHPIDDARSTNPPSNPELLDALAQDFVASGFDVKHLIRVITSSHAYRLEAAPHAGNAGDTQTFARFYPRRVTAEVLLDGVSQVLDVPTNFPGVPVGTRATELPDENVTAHFLDVFGRPARMSACECERVDAPALTQALELVNSAEIQRKLTDKAGYAQRLSTSDKSHADLAAEAILRVLARRPRPEELKAAVDFLESEPDRAEACRSLLWSLLATNEFLFNH
ncbi:MAG: DUF1553 domain-containing protein [Planctomycetales bacterium]|nr:DUF1553 domain-containing protein [Planctomycetales bacterium]